MTAGSLRWSCRVFVCVACPVGVFAGASAACGGRTQLVPAYQIGRLSSDAIVANDSGVRVVVRTAAWPDPQIAFSRIQPIEMTFDNASSHPLSVDQNHIALVTDAGQRLSSIPPTELPQMADSELASDRRLPIVQMKNRALAEGVLPLQGRRSGFVYFERPDDTQQLHLEIDLVSADSGTQFGTIMIPFLID